MMSEVGAPGMSNLRCSAPRQLMWRPTLGTVEVEVMRGELELQLSVSTMEAAVLSHFQRKDRWGQDELAAEMGINRATLRRKAVVWINQGLLVEEKKRDLETADPTARRSRRFRGTRLANAGTQPLRAMQVMETRPWCAVVCEPSLRKGSMLPERLG